MGKKLYYVFMKTLTVTDGRARLGYWLKRAIEGEDIGFVMDGVVVGLRPVEVVSSDYALREYGLTHEEAAAAQKRISSEIKAARQRGEVKSFTGTADDFR
jgi:hypothetical protein